VRKSAGKKKKVTASQESDTIGDAIANWKAKRKTPTNMRRTPVEEDEDSEERVPTKKPGKGKLKAPFEDEKEEPVKPKAKKKKKVIESEEEDDIPVKKPPKKQKGSGKKSARDIAEHDEEEDYASELDAYEAPKKKGKNKQKTAAAFDEDSEAEAFDDEGAAGTRGLGRPGQGKKGKDGDTKKGRKNMVVPADLAEQKKTILEGVQRRLKKMQRQETRKVLGAQDGI